MVLRKVTKVGNSLGITFPAEMLKKANIALGDDIEIEYKDGEIVIKKSQKITLPDEQMGVKNPHLLESTLSRPKQSLLGKDACPSIHAKAAALFQSLAQNHAFHNANKRTALSQKSSAIYNG